MSYAFSANSFSRKPFLRGFDVFAEINRYWRMQVAMLDMSTFSIRECLLDDQPIEGWLRNFQQYVVPFVNTYVKSSRGGM